MIEIARNVALSLKAVGIASSIIAEDDDSFNKQYSVSSWSVTGSGDSHIHIIIAPHEYFHFLRHNLTDLEWQQRLIGFWGLNTEQPGSLWFDQALEYAHELRGYFDISLVGFEEIRRRNFRVHYLPQAVRSIEQDEREQLLRQRRKYDIVFFGSSSQKRIDFISRNWRRLANYNTHIRLVDPSDVRREGRGGYLGETDIKRIVEQSTLTINLHSSESDYFEWHRALISIQSFTVFATESSKGYAPLSPGKDFLMAPLDQLMDKIESLLTQPVRIKQMAVSAYAALESEYSYSAVGNQLLSSADFRPSEL